MLGEAHSAALAATSMDPLRESAQQLLIKATLAQGNTADAVRIYNSYRESLQREPGIDPSRNMGDLVWSGRQMVV